MAGPRSLLYAPPCRVLEMKGDERGRAREKEKCRYRFWRTIYPRKKLYLASSSERTAALSSYARTTHDRAVIIDARVRIPPVEPLTLAHCDGNRKERIRERGKSSWSRESRDEIKLLCGNFCGRY